jgi:hypothetical protein
VVIGYRYESCKVQNKDGKTMKKKSWDDWQLRAGPSMHTGQSLKLLSIQQCYEIKNESKQAYT